MVSISCKTGGIYGRGISTPGRCLIAYDMAQVILDLNKWKSDFDRDCIETNESNPEEQP